MKRLVLCVASTIMIAFSVITLAATPPILPVPANNASADSTNQQQSTQQTTPTQPRRALNQYDLMEMEKLKNLSRKTDQQKTAPTPTPVIKQEVLQATSQNSPSHASAGTVPDKTESGKKIEGKPTEPKVPAQEISRQAAVAQNTTDVSVTSAKSMKKPKAEEPQKVTVDQKSAPTSAPKTLSKDEVKKVVESAGNLALAIDRASPKLWQIMLAQQRTKAIANCTVPLGVIIILITHMFLVGHVWKPREKTADISEDPAIKSYNDGRLWAVRIVPIILTCLSSLWLFNRLSDSMELIFNPELPAVQELLSLLLKNGM